MFEQFQWENNHHFPTRSVSIPLLQCEWVCNHYSWNVCVSSYIENIQTKHPRTKQKLLQNWNGNRSYCQSSIKMVFDILQSIKYSKSKFQMKWKKKKTLYLSVPLLLYFLLLFLSSTCYTAFLSEIIHVLVNTNFFHFTSGLSCVLSSTFRLMLRICSQIVLSLVLVVIYTEFSHWIETEASNFKNSSAIAYRVTHHLHRFPSMTTWNECA